MYPVRTKTAAEDETLEQFSHVIHLYLYLSYNVTFLEERDVDIKIQNFENMCRTIRRTLQENSPTDTQMKSYQIVDVYALQYESE